MITLADLAPLSRWVAWRNELRGDDLTKVPYYGKGQKAEADDPKTWITRAHAEVLLPRIINGHGGGVGLELGDLGNGIGIGGVDLDACRDSSGAIESWAAEVIELFNSYTETSPSGTGAKQHFEYKMKDLPALRAAMGKHDSQGSGKKWARGKGRHAPSIELYLDGRYFAITEQQLPTAPPEIRPVSCEQLIRLISDLGPRFKRGDAGERRKGGGTDSTRSATAFRKGAALRRQGRTFEEMCAALRADPETADWCRDKGEANGQRELRRIWDRAGEQANAVDQIIAEFNKLFMVVREAGKAVIYALAEDPILHRRFFDRLTFSDLRSLYMNRRVEVGRDGKGNPITRPVADVWLNHANRRQFIRGVTFDPSGAPSPPGTLNLWQGFAVKPKPGDWALMREHIRVIVCSENKRYFDYFIDWMALVVQRPAEQGEVAVVMQGDEGCGKSTPARALKRLLGQHGLAISNSKHLTGNFNAHLRDCVLLFADEAFFAGDRAHVGVLKSLITEPYLTIEGKYQNAIQTPNFLHIMMASNNEWVVPASLRARRFYVLAVGNEARNNYEYFAAIWKQMDNGGYEAMLYDLLHRDLSKFDVRNVPETDALQHQKKLSLETTESWWLDVLHRGYVFKSKLGLESYFSQWYEEVSTELLFASYSDYADRHHERHPLSREHLGRFLVKMGCHPKRPNADGVVGEHFVDSPSNFGTTRKAELIRQTRPCGYKLGDLAAARHDFEEKAGLATAWEPEVST